MALIETGIRTVANRMPKVITPKAHAIIDYAIAGSFFLMGALFWRRNKRAAVASMALGAAKTATAMMTDYPGGISPVISFETHGKIDAGMAGMIGLVPTLLVFGGESEAMFFRGQAVATAAVTAMTDFEAGSSEKPRRRRRAA
jgi:hypothetical protein